MPTLVPEEKRQSSIFALPKPNIIIFDGLRLIHEPCIRAMYADFVESFWIDRFSLNNLDRGGIGDAFVASDILNLNPLLFVTELELVPSRTDRIDGIQLLENIRKIPGFRLMPPALVITNSVALSRAHHNFQRLNVPRAFTWEGLRYPSEQDRLRRIVRQLTEGC
jgi:hypothetical protein